MTATTHLEVEFTYAVDLEAQVPDLSSIKEIYRVGSDETFDLVAKYYDTAKLDLIHAGITLRQRSGGHDAGWHLKMPGAFGRIEQQFPVQDELPQELADMLRGVVGDKPLVHIATVANHRRQQTYLDAYGQEVFQLCDDTIESSSPLKKNSRQQWREWEVELCDDALTQADRWQRKIAKRLIAAGAREDAIGSKLLHALGELYQPPTHLQGLHARMQHELLHAWRGLVVADILARHGDGDEETLAQGFNAAVARCQAIITICREVDPRGKVLEAVLPQLRERSQLAALSLAARQANVQLAKPFDDLADACGEAGARVCAAGAVNADPAVTSERPHIPAPELADTLEHPQYLRFMAHLAKYATKFRPTLTPKHTKQALEELLVGVDSLPAATILTLLKKPKLARKYHKLAKLEYDYALALMQLHQLAYPDASETDASGFIRGYLFAHVKRQVDKAYVKLDRRGGAPYLW